MCQCENNKQHYRFFDRSAGTADYERGAKIRPTSVGTSNETLKKKEHYVPETTTL